MSQKFRFHVLSLPNSRVKKDECNWDAYQSKVLKVCKALTMRNHDVFLYAVEGSEAEANEIVPVMSSKELETFFPNYDMTRSYSPIEFNASKPYWQLFNNNCIEEIKKRYQPKDFVLIIAGLAQLPVVDALASLSVLQIEWSVGYYGIIPGSKTFKIYESYVHQARCEATINKDSDVSFFSYVVPSLFDKDDFEFNPMPEKDNCVFVGRCVARKGISIAVEATKRAGVNLTIYGQGVKEVKGNRIFTDDNAIYEGSHIRYGGFLTPQKRSEVMGKAMAVLVPTIYVEPLGNTSLESMACGSPVVCTDAGGFVDNVIHGKTGFRCRTLEEFTWAIKNARTLDRKYIHDYAMKNFSLERVGEQLEHCFKSLSYLWTKEGWYKDNPDRTDLNHLVKYI